MPSSASETWRPLLATAPGVPPLLVSTIFRPESYSVRLTDLVQIWSEDMSRSQIVERARRERTSINPSESGQATKMIELLRAALVIDDPLHHTTTVTLSVSSTESRGQQKHELILRVTASLAKPFKPLRWPIHLQRAASSAIATQLVLPLAHTSRIRATEIDTLVAVMADKDAVIARLLDKLDQVGLGPEHVFTSLASATSGRRGFVLQEVAEARVKGLAKFDAEAFRNKEAKAMAGDENLDQPGTGASQDVGMSDTDGHEFALLGSAFGESSLPESRANLIYGSPRRAGAGRGDEWWTDLDQSQRLDTHQHQNEEIKDKPSSPARPPSSTLVIDNEETASEDDFQVQVTPSKRRSAQNQKLAEVTSRTTGLVPNANSGGDGDGDDGASFQVQATPSKVKPSPAARTAARRNEQESSDDDEFQTQETPAKIRAARESRGVVSERKRDCVPDDDSNGEEDGSGREASSPNSKPVVRGKIGGAKRAKQVLSSPPPPPPPPPPPRAPALLHKSGSKQHARHRDADPEAEAPSTSEEDDDNNFPEPKSKPKSKSGGLGRIGGKTKRVPTPSRSPSEGEARTTGTPGRTRRGIGRIGGKGSGDKSDKHVRKDDDDDDDDDDDNDGDETESPGSEEAKTGSRKRGPAASAASRPRPGPTPAPMPDPAPLVPETDAERALRKRAELERELARKKAAGPAKKKRKF